MNARDLSVVAVGELHVARERVGGIGKRRVEREHLGAVIERRPFRRLFRVDADKAARPVGGFFARIQFPLDAEVNQILRPGRRTERPRAESMPAMPATRKNTCDADRSGRRRSAPSAKQPHSRGPCRWSARRHRRDCNALRDSRQQAGHLDGLHGPRLSSHTCPSGPNIERS